MSSVTKCDRCVEIFKPTDFFIAATLKSKTEYKRLDCVRTALSNWLGFAIPDSMKHYDLCPSCQRKLYRFLHGEDPEEDRETS